MKHSQSVPEQHQTKIAIQTLKMNPAAVAIMGGMTIEEARNHLRRMGWSEQRIEALAS